jgi:nucleoside permease NupC
MVQIMKIALLFRLTQSETHAVMAGGYATMAGGALAILITLGNSASHLLAASFMSAPAALAFSKLFYPETEESVTTYKHIQVRSELKVILFDFILTICLEVQRG